MSDKRQERPCTAYRAIDEGHGFAHRNPTPAGGCAGCVFFSARNCRKHHTLASHINPIPS